MDIRLHFVGRKGEMQPPLLRDRIGVPDAHIIGSKPHNTAQQSPIRTVTPVGLCKRAVEGKVHPDNGRRDHLLSQLGDQCRTGRVRAGWADHIGAQHIKDADKRHGVLSFFVLLSASS